MQQVERIGTVAKAGSRTGRRGIVDRILILAGSVRLGIVLLVLLGLFCTVGMLIMQQNVEGFGEYYAGLSSRQKLVLGSLGFFNIYNSWYFNALLCAISLNIVIATIERLPKAFRYYSRPAVAVPVRWLREQENARTIELEEGLEDVSTKIAAAFRTSGFEAPLRRERSGNVYHFFERGRWNRLAFASVHVALLTIFLGGFLTAQLGSNGSLALYPGQTTNLMFDTAFDLEQIRRITKQLPFEIACYDIEQQLIRRDGPLTPDNTIDWITRFTINDEMGVHEAEVRVNKPFDHRGYRFFQAGIVTVGRARSIRLAVTNEATNATEEVTILRNRTTKLSDGTRLIFSEFRGDFSPGAADTDEDTTSFPNPAAIVHIEKPGGGMATAIVLGSAMADAPELVRPYGGYTFRMLDFERVADQHILAVQRDPGSPIVYLGFGLLTLTLCGVFGFSHRRIWAAVIKTADGATELVLAGNANRDQDGLTKEIEKLEFAVNNEMREANK